MRVVLDSRLRLSPDSRLAQSAKLAQSKDDVLVISASSDAAKTSALESLGIRVTQVPSASDGHVDLHHVLKVLGELEITTVLIEGGSHLNTAALDGGIVDKAWLYLAPKIFGDSAVPFTADLQKALSLHATQVHQFGHDFAIEGYLRDPYGS